MLEPRAHCGGRFPWFSLYFWGPVHSTEETNVLEIPRADKISKPLQNLAFLCKNSKGTDDLIKDHFQLISHLGNPGKQNREMNLALLWQQKSRSR